MMYGVVTLYFPHLEGPFNTHPSHHVTVPFFINGRSHHPRNPDSPVPYSCKLASSTVTVFNRIYITPSFHISFFRISIFFFDSSNARAWSYDVHSRWLFVLVRSVHDVDNLFVHCEPTRFYSTSSRFVPQCIYLWCYKFFPPQSTVSLWRVHVSTTFSVFTYSCTSCSYTVCNTVLWSTVCQLYLS